MPILELPPNPSRLRDPNGDDSGAPPNAAQPIKVRTGRFGELEEHEIIHLLSAIDDELARASFRESVYISTIFCLAIAWFLFYGPRVLFHQPDYKDLISAMKEHDKAITYVQMPHVTPRPPAHAIPDRKMLQQLQQQPRPTPPAPAQPQAPPPPPQEQAHTTAPPVAQPQLPLPSAPRPAQPLVDAPSPSPKIAQNSTSPHDDMNSLIRGSRPGQGGGPYAPSPGSGGRNQPGAEILSDTMGVDFSAYMRRLHSDIQRNWDPLIPEEAQPPLLKKGVTGIRFTILPDGRIGSMILETPSGDRALDEAAWHGITSEGNFPPLPREFHGPQLELRVHFFYNIPIQQ
jgi:TonB family protein